MNEEAVIGLVNALKRLERCYAMVTAAPSTLLLVLVALTLSCKSFVFSIFFKRYLFILLWGRWDVFFWGGGLLVCKFDWFTLGDDGFEIGAKSPEKQNHCMTKRMSIKCCINFFFFFMYLNVMWSSWRQRVRFGFGTIYYRY